MKIPTPNDYVQQHMTGLIAASVLFAFGMCVLSFGIGLVVWESLFRATGLMIVSALGSFVASMLLGIFVIMPLAYRNLVRKAKAKAEAEAAKVEKPANE